MKIIKIKKSKKFSKEFGWLEIVKFYFFGIHFLTEQNKIYFDEE